MLLAHISDFHVFARQAETPLVRADVVDACRKVVADLAAFTPGIDVVALTGDLTDGGSPDDYALLKEVLAPIAAPIFVVPGNHDKRATLRAAFADTHRFESGDDLRYEVQFRGVRILGLDTLVEGPVWGQLLEPQLDWLRARLAEPVPELTIILMHHPAFPSGIVASDAMCLREGRAEFERIVQGYRGRLRILSGHIHRPFHAIWHSAFCAVGGGPSFQKELLLAPDAGEPPLVHEPYCYFVHRWEDPDSIAVHTRFVSI